jgi:hypothetical protein
VSIPDHSTRRPCTSDQVFAGGRYWDRTSGLCRVKASHVYFRRCSMSCSTFSPAFTSSPLGLLGSHNRSYEYEPDVQSHLASSMCEISTFHIDGRSRSFAVSIERSHHSTRMVEEWRESIPAINGSQTSPCVAHANISFVHRRASGRLSQDKKLRELMPRSSSREQVAHQWPRSSDRHHSPTGLGRSRAHFVALGPRCHQVVHPRWAYSLRPREPE